MKQLAGIECDSKWGLLPTSLKTTLSIFPMNEDPVFENVNEKPQRNHYFMKN
jgi:hypothetical protein